MRLKGSLQPIVLQISGLILLVAFVVIWSITGDQSPLLVGAALVLVGVGSGTSAIITVRQEIQVKDEASGKTVQIEENHESPTSDS